jgi:hypothetical protein
MFEVRQNKFIDHIPCLFIRKRGFLCWLRCAIRVGRGYLEERRVQWSSEYLGPDVVLLLLNVVVDIEFERFMSKVNANMFARVTKPNGGVYFDIFANVFENRTYFECVNGGLIGRRNGLGTYKSAILCEEGSVGCKINTAPNDVARFQG